MVDGGPYHEGGLNPAGRSIHLPDHARLENIINYYNDWRAITHSDGNVFLYPNYLQLKCNPEIETEIIAQRDELVAQGYELPELNWRPNNI